MCSNISSVFLGGNRLDGGLHGAPREHDALHAQVGVEFLLCFVILLFVIGHQALVVFIAAVICYHVFFKWGSVPVVFSAVFVIYQVGNMVSTQSCCLLYTLLFSSLVGIEEKNTNKGKLTFIREFLHV